MKLKIFGAAFAANALAISGAIALDQELPAYQATTGISGQIKSVGSDTLNTEAGLWAKGFSERYPAVKIEIEGKGSATAPPALLQGTSQFAPMSRPMSDEEAAAFETKYGYKASSIRVAVDALAIYVNKDNPILCLAMPQLNRIFSSTRKVTGGENIKVWGDLELSGEWANKPIVAFGRNTISGTYEFFRELVLYGGEFKAEVKPQVGSEAVVQGVANDKFAIGYSGLGYKMQGVRTVPVSQYQGGKCYNTTAEATYSGSYPIARYLYLYVNKKPSEPLDALRAEFIKYVLSKDGQTQTEMGGYYSITNVMREQDLKKLGLATLAN